jgi:hypothetical protein
MRQTGMFIPHSLGNTKHRPGWNAFNLLSLGNTKIWVQGKRSWSCDRGYSSLGVMAFGARHTVTLFHASDPVAFPP